MKYKTIIFDWSGTISDDRIPVYEANNLILKQYGIEPPSFEDFLSQAVSSFPEKMKQLRINEEESALAEMYRKTYEEVTKNGTAPQIYHDVISVLSKLSERRKRLAVLSSHPQQSLEREAEHYGVKDYFSTLRGSSFSKARALSEMCIEFETTKENTIYIGDMMHDIDAARSAGIQQAAVATGYHKKEWLEAKNPSIGVFNSLTEFLEAIS